MVDRRLTWPLHPTAFLNLSKGRGSTCSMLSCRPSLRPGLLSRLTPTHPSPSKNPAAHARSVSLPTAQPPAPQNKSSSLTFRSVSFSRAGAISPQRSASHSCSRLGRLLNHPEGCLSLEPHFRLSLHGPTTLHLSRVSSQPSHLGRLLRSRHLLRRMPYTARRIPTPTPPLRTDRLNSDSPLPRLVVVPARAFMR